MKVVYFYIEKGIMKKKNNNSNKSSENSGSHRPVTNRLNVSPFSPVPRVQAVVYTTRSRYQAENEQVVNQALEATNAPQNGRRAPFKVRLAPFKLRLAPFKPEDPKEAARSALARARSKGVLDKKESRTQQQTAEGAEITTPASGKSRSKSKKSHAPAEAKSSGSGLKQKLSHHKSPASVGARLYQAGLISRMEQVKLRPPKPEHIRVIKHPAPFSNPLQAAKL
ncbi:hypothetical protein ElyMa_001927400 [Elysia marginata]|uniref:Uncharacterized protein n=1 Tax=Elysia marginata TaxID=1093978 RepID=A0AAV4EV85_9GAST|nr:hypothetical protein ElyMa_001927400 [Elysia marginata]